MGGGLEIRTTASPATHTYYAELFARPPPGVTYRPLPTGWGHPMARSGAASWALWKARAAWNLVGGLSIDRYPDDLVGAGPVLASQTILANRVPWALDLDVASALTGFRHEKIAQPPNRALLGRAVRAPRCRAVTYWSQIARRGTESLLRDERIAAKGMLLPPAVDAARFPDRTPRGGDGFHVLFVGRQFAMKGGVEAMLALQDLLSRHPRASATIVTNADEAPSSPDPRIEVRSRVAADELEREFDRADAFLFPTLYEVFGLVVLEAMARGLPVVTCDTFAVPEMLTDGVEGYVVPQYAARSWDEDGIVRRGFEEVRVAHRADERARLVRDLAERLDALARDPGLRARMGLAGRERARKGPFSVAAQQHAAAKLAERLAA